MCCRLLGLLITVALALSAKTVHAQAFGIELMNNVMPASGGMAGASNALPQDLQSAVYGNPATIAQFHGTQFSMGGAWLEPTYTVNVAPPGLPAFGVAPYDAKSDAQGVAGGNVGVAQDFRALGKPVTLGLGLFAGAGAGVDFRDTPQSNGTHANIVALDIVTGAGVDLTDRLAVGATIHFSNATLDGPFVGISGSSSDYALRGALGFDFELREDTTLGAYWKTKAGYTFENLAAFPADPTNFQDVKVDRPQIFGLGVANHSLMCGRLLLAMDASWQSYTDTALFGAIFEDQWALQFGAQYAANERVRLRLGYAWSENPMRGIVAGSAGGVLPPGGAAHVQYIEALFAAIPQHRLTGGVGVQDVLPGIDMNFFAGGVFDESQTFGLTTASVESYWIGTGLTWRFGRGSCGTCWH